MQNQNSEKNDNTLLILGGGLAGLSLAIQLKKRQPQLSIRIIERAKHPVDEAAHKVGESLVELSSHYFSEVLGLKQHLLEEQLPKLGLRFFFRPQAQQAPEQRLQDVVEFGAKVFPHTPSYQLDRGIFENFLAQHAQSLGVEFIDGHKVIDVDIQKKLKDHHITIENLSDAKQQTLSCRWVVDACSRNSPIKRKLELKKDSAHKVSSAWFRLSCELDVNTLNNDVTWLQPHQKDNSRWFSTNHFMGKGYWLWFIPLSSGSTSIGIVAENESHPLTSYNSLDKALELLIEHEPLALSLIEPHLEQLQDFRVLKDFSHDCEQVFNKDRWFLTGEAGVFLDPFYSPGSDLIAISNTFICNLIDADINDSDTFPSQCLMLDMFYLNLFKNTALIYQDMYSVYHHPVVMPIKILWDFSVYWSFTSFLFIQGKFESTAGIFKLRSHFEDIGMMNEHIQKLLKHWAELQPEEANAMYIDPFDIDFLNQLNQGLHQEFKDEKSFEEQFIKNLEQLKTQYQAVCQNIYQRYPDLKNRVAASSIYQDNANKPENNSGISQMIDQLANIQNTA